MKYDYLIVGAGFFGSICAYELNKRGKNVCVIDKRNHIGGNCYTSNRDGINVHDYGPHIFHTSNEDVWNWINQFVSFNDFTLRPVANYKGEIYSLPFNMWTFSKIFNITLPKQAKEIIAKESSHIGTPSNFEEQAIKLVGTTVYEKLIKGYTEKQWQKKPKDLPKEIIQRLPVRFDYDNNYFNDKYQGIPIGGYTQIFDKLLQDIDVILNTDFFTNTLPAHDKIIYTGPIDRFFNYKFGELEYKTTKFDHRRLDDIENYQGTAMMTYTFLGTPYTRTIEHKHFENTKSDLTWVTWEYPDFYDKTKEPFYPVNDLENQKKFVSYIDEASKLDNVYFGGRLAEYKYYDMDKVIESALKFVSKI